MATPEYTYAGNGIRARIVLTSATHIHFDANRNSLGSPEHPDTCYMTIRGIRYGVSAHFYLWSDGSWNLGKEGSPDFERNYYQLHMVRVDDPRKQSVNLSPRLQAIKLITAIVRQWVQDHPQALIDAGQMDKQRQRETLLDKILAVKAEIQAAQILLQQLEQELEENR